MANPISQLKSLQAKLQAEREDRKKTEEEACKLLRSYKQKYDASLQEKSAIIRDLKIQLETEKQRNQVLETECSSSKEQLKEQVRELKELKEQVRELKEQLKSREDESKRSRSKSPRKASSSRDRSTSKRRQEICGRRSSTAADGVTDDLVKEVERLTEELKCLEATMEAKDFELARSKERAKFSREINIDLRTQNASLQKEVSELTARLDAVLRECEERVKGEVESVKKSRRDVEKKLKEEERNRDKLMEDMKSLKKIIEKRDKEIEKYSSEANELKKAVENYRKEKEKEIEKEKCSLMKELKDLKNNLDKKSHDLQKQTQMADILKKTCNEIEKQVSDLFDWTSLFINCLISD